MNSGEDGGSRSASAYDAERLGLSDATYVLLRELIAERTGVMFDAAKRPLLADKLSDLVTANGLGSFLDYYYLLRYDDAADEHWAALMNRLAVPETYFWRQPEQLEAAARIVATEHFAKDPNAPLRIWSAACCTGEEPLSLAIALAEAGLLDSRSIEIVATDGSGAMIERAKRGVYGERSFRQLPATLRAKYFEPDDSGRCRPIERIRRAVRWGIVNLTREPEVDLLASSDLIFCRNVFIYFSDDAITKVARMFAVRMPSDGYLFLGAAESLTRLDVDLELTEVGKAFAYVKRGQRELLERPAAGHARLLRDLRPAAR